MVKTFMAKLPEKLKSIWYYVKYSKQKTEHNSIVNLKILGKNFIYTLSVDYNGYVLSKKLSNI